MALNRQNVEHSIDKHCVDNFMNNASNIKHDLDRLVDYLWENEHTNWEELDNPENHIFIAINNVRNWLEGQVRLEKKYAELMNNKGE
tara:strand:+ start:244 stop:504 length:261 start_codon:yes stop_codon:yes gene_type:complete